MNASPTQIASHIASLPGRPRQKDIVAGTLRDYKGALSREYIAVLSGMRLSSVCATVHAMMKDGTLVDAGTTYNDETRRTVQLVKLAGAMPQQGVH